jgi:CDP-glucose 4,6-dehydratase
MTKLTEIATVFGGKRVLVTGHTGFKGAWLSLWLEKLGANVTGVGLAPHTKPSLFDLARLSTRIDDRRCDIRHRDALAQIVAEVKPEFVFHLAAQALVRASYESPVETLATNVLGTAHLLESVRTHAPQANVVVVTSDKCYENREWVWPYREVDPLGGHDPYSASKACAEIIAASWRRSFSNEGGPRIATARAGNVIGGGDWSADRIMPDCVRALARGEPIVVRNPAAIRPWQHVLEPLSGYLLLAAKLHESPTFAEAWNFGPDDEDTRTVEELVETVVTAWGDGASWCAKKKAGGPHEASALTLSSTKAKHELGWRPTWRFDRAVCTTIGWYKAYLTGADTNILCRDSIAEFTDKRTDTPMREHDCP